MRNGDSNFQQPRRKFLQDSGAIAGSLLLPLAACAQNSKEGSPSLVPPGYKLTFEDDFIDSDVSRINENATGGKPGAPAWRSRYRHARSEIINSEKQIYVDAAYTGLGTEPLGIQPFSIADGILTIRAERTPPALVTKALGKAYTSGCITTELTHWQTYGYFEMHARLPRGKGFWPAFWLLPKRLTWPPEIDILEGSGAKPRSIHVGLLDQSIKTATTGIWVDDTIDTTDGFHTYAAEWTHEKIVFLVDGKQIFQVAPHGIHEDMYLLANLALGSKDAGWIPDPDDSTPFPGKFEIDYIRAYSKA
jgi:serralysin